MKTIVIIQARMGSTRLPGKVLLPLGSTVVLDYVVSRCRQIDKVDEVIVATSTLEQDDKIVQWCEANGVTVFRGSEDDVLARYYECAKPYLPDYVIRVTGDCPFVDVELANKVIAKMVQQPSDIVLFSGILPNGLVVEMVSFTALEYIYIHGHEPRHREHVTYYAYEYLPDFTSVMLEIPEGLRHPELRLTLDTSEDYELCMAISNHFGGDKLVSAARVVDYLVKHPEIASLNAHIQQKAVQ